MWIIGIHFGGKWSVKIPTLVFPEMHDNRQSRGHMDTWRAQHITFFQCLHIHLIGHSSGVAEKRLINFVNVCDMILTIHVLDLVAH
jgi:hypothetical protein